VQDANLGFNEPWMALAAWDLTGKPAVKAELFAPPLASAAAVGR